MTSATTLLPFAFARSALFALPVDWVCPVNPQPIAAAKDYAISILYAGPRLTHRHAAIWQAAVALSHNREGEQVKTDQKLIALLRAMGLASVQTNAKRRALGLLGDLHSGRVIIDTPCHSFEGRLLNFSDLGNGRVSVSLPPDFFPSPIVELVRLPLITRARLYGYPLALWLHDWIATHRAIYYIKLTTLRTLCGSQLSPHHFRSRLIDALDRVKVCAPFFTGYDIQGDELTIRKTSTSVVLPNKKHPIAKTDKRWQDMNAIERARAARTTPAL